MSSTTQPATSWHRGRVAGWIVSVDHKRVGALYLAWAAVFLVIGGILPLLMRIQMTKPDAGFLGDSTYAGMRTMHGTLLVFFVLVPVVVGLATYLVPLMIGADRIEKPGLAAMSLWLFGFGGAAVVLSAFAKGGSSEAGWAGYPPTAITQDGHGVDLWLIGMILLALSVLASAGNLVATIQMRRAAGMTWPNLPVFAWSVLVWGFVSLVLVPLAALGLVLILLERRYPGTFDFFLTDDNEVKPWLTWLFGQSFAYAALVPVFGVIAEVVAVFGGRAVANAKLLGQALVAYAGLTFVLVLYHAYAGAEGKDPSVVLLVLAVVATIPSVVAFALLAGTVWRARSSIRWSAPMVFAGGALVLFAVGLVSALVLVVLGTSRDLRGTAFGSAHAHYLLWGTGLLALLAALTYWWPKIFGRLLDRRLTWVAAVLLFVGFNFTFFFEFFLGDNGQPASASSFSKHGSDQAYNVISTVGAFATGLGLLLYLVAVIRSHQGRRAGNDPWRGDTLEWYTTSPPPPHNFDSLPPIASSRPLADLRQRLQERNALYGNTAAVAPGPVLRVTIAAAAAATAAVVASAALGTGRGHWAAALVALPLLAAAVIVSRIDYPRLLAATSAALVLMVAAVATGGLVALTDTRWAVTLHVTAAAASLAASLVALVLSLRGETVPLGPWRDYVTLTKPRIMTLLLLTGAAGMFVGAQGLPQLWSFVAAMLGLALACGGASALNHVLDADIDRLMGARTAGRPVASGRVAAPRALEFGVALMALSFALLATTVNVLTAVLALVGGLFYVVVYTGYLKRSTDRNIVIGGAAGAVPPLVGYAAATGSLALPALWLFLIVFLWTPPHFWALALMIKEHYEAAKVPMLPGTRGVRETTRQILLYSLVLVAFTIGVGWWLGPVYTGAAVLLGAYFLLLAWQLRRDTSRRRAVVLFHYSLAYLALLFVAAAVDPLLV